MITLEQVTAEEARAKAASQERAEAERKLSESPYSEQAALNLTEASKRAAQISASAREMRQAYDAQTTPAQAEAERRRMEKAAAAEIGAAGKELEERRKAMEKAAEVAQKALVELLDAAFAYNGAVGTHAKVLTAKGLGVSLLGPRPSTGGGQGLGGPVVVLDREQWTQVDAGAVAVWVVHRVGAARLPSMHPVSAHLRFFDGCAGVAARERQLFARLSKPKKIEYAPLRVSRPEEV